MTTFGYFLSSEEHPPKKLVEQAVAAEEAGFSSVFISDHFHPWLDAQGESSFVWSVIGAISEATELSVTTCVTCPTVRIHPAVIAHATATAHLLCEGRFRLGVGSGENLNEHILGDRWPPPATRLEMLEEAIEIIRAMLEGGLYSHHGRHYTVENARLYSVPDRRVPILVSAFGPKAISLAARAGDGFISTKPIAEHVATYREAGGTGPVVGGCKLCWAPREEEAVETAYRLWSTEALPGQISQELPMPRHYKEICSVVTRELVASVIPCGPDPERHLATIQKFVEAGFDEIYVNQVGADTLGFLEFFERELRPALF